MEMRKATKAEVEELARTGQMAENSTFDGVNYMVAVKKDTKTSGSGSTENKTDKK